MPNRCRLPRPTGSALLPRLMLMLAALAGAGLVGCKDAKPAPKEARLAPRYQALPPKQVPAFLKDTVLERCDLGNAEPFPISGFGLIANLHGTGDSFAGTAVREYIRSQMIKRGLGSKVYGTDNMPPEAIFRDPRWAIVRVDGFIPPGARRHQRFDVFVSALDGNNTTSLAHGDLYQTDLKVNGANLQRPGYTIDVWAIAEGSVFVNPAYALATGAGAPEMRNSLRQGIVMSGGIALMDRPLILRLRQPQLSMSRALEHRIDQVFQDIRTASAKDEALISLLVPDKYGSDWERFAQVAMHTFLNPSPEFAVMKAKQLGEEAIKPDAPLLDISYCWEALGPTALPFVTPLMTHDRPEVAFAAARAAVFLGDSAAETILMDIASNSSHPFQIAAVQTLGKRPASPVINQMLRRLLDVDTTLVRLEAYRALANNEDASVISRRVGAEKFRLDIVPSQGPPIIYASRTGMPRIAVIGNKPQIALPVMFTAIGNRLSVSSESDRRLVRVYYRGDDVPEPVSFLSSPDAAEFIARLGGEGAPGDPKLNFDYCTVVAILQSMSDQQRFITQGGGKRQSVAFVLQDAPRLQQAIEDAPAIPEQVSESPPSSDQKIINTVDSRLNQRPVE